MPADKCIQCHERDALPEQTRCYECGGYGTVVDEVAKIGPARMAALDRLMARLEASEKPRQAKTRIVDDLMAQPFIARLEANEGKAATLDDVLRDMASEEAMSRYPKYPVLSVDEIVVPKTIAPGACDWGTQDKPEPSWAARKVLEAIPSGSLSHQYSGARVRRHIEDAILATIAECARVAEECDYSQASDEQAGGEGVEIAVMAIRKLGES